MKLERIGILAHPKRPNTAPVAAHIARTFNERGLATWVSTVWTDADIAGDLAATDMVIAIGGDGAMLRAARAAAPFNVPVLGINMGYLGFLTEVTQPDAPNEWEHALAALLRGDCWIERRMMLHVEARHGDGSLHAMSDALNDAVISRGDVTRMIRVPLYIDGDWTTTYHADALIIATPTGSTAYALASGGPILPPELRNILIVPVAPHLSLDRPIVLPEGAAVRAMLEADGETDPVLAVDGEPLCKLHSGDTISVYASEHTAQFVRLRDRTYFYRSLLDRLEPRVTPPNTSRINDGR
ncbi:MAG: NAD(+)/NADH kinase [bacterium]|nr:NAD(+)/NADH kinase [bacterium]